MVITIINYLSIMQHYMARINCTSPAKTAKTDKTNHCKFLKNKAAT